MAEGRDARGSGLRSGYSRVVPEAVRGPLHTVRRTPGRTYRALHHRLFGVHPPSVVAAREVERLKPRVARRSANDQTAFSFIAHQLELRHNHWENRCSPEALRGLHHTFRAHPLEGRTVVELGPGSANPFGFLLVLVLLGADRAIGIDIEAPADDAVAARAAATTVAWMLTAPALVVGDHPVPSATVRERAAELDCERLWRGDLSALDGSRVELHRAPAHATGLRPASVDLIISNSVLEHLVDPAAAMAELARITRPGGRGHHNIDASDHGRYRDPDLSDLAFLEVGSDEPLVRESNRLRPHQLASLCTDAGFVVDELRPVRRVEVSEAAQARFSEPYRSMDRGDLGLTQAGLLVHLPAPSRPGS